MTDVAEIIMLSLDFIFFLHSAFNFRVIEMHAMRIKLITSTEALSKYDTILQLTKLSPTSVSTFARCGRCKFWQPRINRKDDGLII